MVLYYESHVTIDPIHENDKTDYDTIAAKYGFKLSKLFMRKDGKDEPHRDDSFMSARSMNQYELVNRMTNLIKQLQGYGMHVRRYKIEQALMDSKHVDVMGLL